MSGLSESRMGTIFGNTGQTKADNAYNSVLTYVAAEAVITTISQSNIDSSTPSKISANFTAVTGGSLTDGTATLSSGALSGVTTLSATGAVTTSGAVTGDLLTDGTATLTSGALSGVTNLTASGTVQWFIVRWYNYNNCICDEDNIASNSDTLIPTQQS